ncbi:hypothetical protein FisN_17Hh068 [Fistulifera solaris]|uniref:Uncharacterized protein n=1 Tax=Fistulifera solaris TaxID=1519565 RepID=A0A1Z5JGL8_FISSO|nr:hypothetical protein FisN_17Hh068 [Fistulifera solaris]|eukprot:GAX13139.1 hypothetical protein FisN_17Hh068 [Fistulifera solaris]
MMYPQATSHGNTLSFVLPGFKQQLNVKFPDSRLAVCEKCKKNFKTRDMCRVRNNHTAPPWTTAYICVTIDDSCLDENGKYTDKPLTVRMVQWQPYCVKQPFGGSKTPVCAACKRTNRTRSFCRERHKHRLLPWCTVYVLLSSLEVADPSTVVADPSSLVDDDDKETGEVVKEEKKSQQVEEVTGEEEEKAPAEDKAGEDETPKESEEKEDDKSARDDQTVLTINSDNGDPGDDINDIAESRTFLVKLSCRGISVHWLELSEYDSSENAPFPGQMQTETQQFVPGMAIPGMDPNMAYYNHNASYAAQQHQNALQSRQQYFFQMQQQQQQFGKRQEWASFAPNGPGDHGTECHPPAAWGLYYAPAGGYAPNHPIGGHEPGGHPQPHAAEGHNDVYSGSPHRNEEQGAKRQRI